MIDVKRYNTFSEYIQELITKLSPEELKMVLTEKIFDLYKHVEPSEVRKEVIKIANPLLTQYFVEVKKDYNKIIKVANDLYQDIGKDITRDMSNIKAIERVNANNIGTYEKREIKRITEIMRDGLENKLKVKDIEKQLIKVGGRVATYAEALANTQLMGYGRAMKYEKAMLGGVKGADYVGDLSDNTRTFCRECLSIGYYTYEEIKNLDNGAGQPKPVSINAGGWRCQHDWEPNPFKK